jgi:hypothetical protein
MKAVKINKAGKNYLLQKATDAFCNPGGKGLSKWLFFGGD